MRRKQWRKEDVGLDALECYAAEALVSAAEAKVKDRETGVHARWKLVSPS
jgi:hypothetical protein